MKKIITIIQLISCIAISAMAQDEGFSVRLDRDSILMGNHFQVSFILENTKVEDFTPPVFEDFDVVSGPNQSSSMMIVNGDVSQSMTYTFILQPKTEGSFFIAPAKAVTVEGDLFTEPLSVNIYPNPEGIIQNSRTRSNSLWDMNFFSMPEFPSMPDMEQRLQPKKPKEPKKKKRKTYKL